MTDAETMKTPEDGLDTVGDPVILRFPQNQEITDTTLESHEDLMRLLEEKTHEGDLEAA